MLKYFIIAFILLFTLNGLMYGDVAFDGNVWRSLPENVKNLYVLGFLHGNQITIRIAHDRLIEGELPKMANFIAVMHLEANIQEVVSRMDSFYQKERNRSIVIPEVTLGMIITVYQKQLREGGK